MKKKFLLLILAGALFSFFTTPLFATQIKLPKLVLHVFDHDTKKPVLQFIPAFTHLSTNEKNGDAFIFRILITSEGYNPYASTIDIPWSFRGKNYSVTNFIISLNSTNVRKVTSPAKRTNINISGIIKNEAGHPLPNVLVRCLDEFQNIVDECITGDNGSYSFTNLPPKKYTLKTTSSRNSLGKEIPLPVISRTPAADPQPTPQPESHKQPMTISTQTVEKQNAPLPRLTKDSVTITSALNGMLVLNWKKTDFMTGILIAMKLGGRTTYITPANDLFENPTNNAFNAEEIILNNRNLQTNGHPLFRDGNPFDLYLYPVYLSSIYSTNSFLLKNIITHNTVPPAMPVLESISVSNKKLTVHWHPSVRGIPLAYKIYIRETNELKLLDTIETFTTEYNLEKKISLPPSFHEATNIYVAVTAIDISKNESDFKEKDTNVEPVTQGSNITQDIVLEKGDLPPAEFPQKILPKAITRPNSSRHSDISIFIANGYRVPAGKFLKIKNKNLIMPRGSRITLDERAILSLENVSIRAASNSSWFGLECRRGSALEMKNSRLSGAETGITANTGAKIFLSGSFISHCATGLSVHSASVILERSGLLKNSRAADISYSTIIFRKHTSIISNGRNFNAAFSSLSMIDSLSAFNRSSFYLLNSPPA